MFLCLRVREIMYKKKEKKQYENKRHAKKSKINCIKKIHWTDYKERKK